MHPIGVDSPHRPSGWEVPGHVGEGLQLHQDRAPPLDGREYHRARHVLAPVLEKDPGRIGYLGQALHRHFEHAHNMGSAEPVLHRSQHAKAVIGIPLEGQDHIDHVLEKLRPGQGPVLGDMAN